MQESESTSASARRARGEERAAANWRRTSSAGLGRVDGLRLAARKNAPCCVPPVPRKRCSTVRLFRGGAQQATGLPPLTDHSSLHGGRGGEGNRTRAARQSDELLSLGLWSLWNVHIGRANPQGASLSTGYGAIQERERASEVLAAFKRGNLKAVHPRQCSTGLLIGLGCKRRW